MGELDNTMIQNIFGGMITFILFAALITFKVAAINTKSPSKSEPFRFAFQRLWVEYVRRLRLTFASAWFWAAAGAWTAVLIVYGFSF